MRLVLKLLLYAAALLVLGWLAAQIVASYQRATAGSTPDASRAYALFAAYLMIGAALAVFVAWDVSRFLGWQASRLFWGGGPVASITPAWWKAERLCKEQRHVEAIQALRDYLEAHPTHWGVAVRIAEIYQHELHEPLPAALEYEELLKQRLPAAARAELMLRRASCHLLMREAEASAALLTQVLEQFPHTSAAATAARRLARMPHPPL